MNMSELFCFSFTLLFLYFVVGNATDCTGPPKTITVSQTGQAQFNTLQSAIKSVPSQNSQWTRIQISSGVYRFIISSYFLIIKIILFYNS